jgi:periplasmic divalent cation tolerance protein
MNEAVFVVLCTVPDAACAERLAALLVEERLGACVSVLPGVRSHYRWEGKQEVSEELLLLIKTTAKTYPALESRLAKEHPYSCPEILALPARAGFEGYLRWVAESTDR